MTVVNYRSTYDGAGTPVPFLEWTDDEPRDRSTGPHESDDCGLPTDRSKHYVAGCSADNGSILV